MSNIVHGNGKRSVRSEEDYHPVPCLDLSPDDRDRKDALLIHEWMAACGFLHMSSLKRYRSIDRTGQQQYAQKNWAKEKDLRGNNGPGDEEMEEDSV